MKQLGHVAARSHVQVLGNPGYDIDVPAALTSIEQVIDRSRILNAQLASHAGE